MSISRNNVPYAQEDVANWVAGLTETNKMTKSQYQNGGTAMKPKMILQISLDGLMTLLLLLVMSRQITGSSAHEWLGTMVSGMILSREVFAFLPISGGIAVARPLIFCTLFGDMC